jgi:hypothetical protein
LTVDVAFIVAVDVTVTCTWVVDIPAHVLVVVVVAVGI